MIKKIDTSLITPSLGARFKSGTLDWLQAQHDESMEQLVRSIFPSLASGTPFTVSNVNVLSGVVNTGSGSTVQTSVGIIMIAAGQPPLYGPDALLLNVPLANFTAAGTPTVFLVKTNPNINVAADPVAFSDGSIHNIHQQWQAVIGDSAAPPTGSVGAICTFSELVYLNNPDWKLLSTLTYHNNWQDGVGHLGLPKFRKINIAGENKSILGEVLLRGTINNTSASSVSASSIFTTGLPAGYRPGEKMFFPVNWTLADPTSGGIAVTAQGIISIDIDGTFEYWSSTGTPNNTDEIALNQIRFLAEN